MRKGKLRFRVAAICVFACTVAVFPGSTSISASHPAPTLESQPARVALRGTNYAMVLPEDPEVTYQGARIVHNVIVDRQKGMRVHANFTVKYGLDVPCRLIAYFFFDDKDTTPLRSGDPKYRTKTGNVSASVNFKPAYDPAVYKDYQLFVPYSALNMESGSGYDLKFYIALYDNEGQRFFGKSGWYKFHLVMP